MLIFAAGLCIGNYWMFEIWKEIIGYEGRYKISNLGNVHSMKTEDNLKLKTDIHGYCYVNLFDGLKHKSYKIHRLVATHFLDNPENKPQVNHLDFDRQNNKINNLEWCTVSENHKHTWKNGRGFNPLHIKGLNNPNTKYSLDDINEMINLRNNGESYQGIASHFGCSHSTVQRLTKQYRQTL